VGARCIVCGSPEVRARDRCATCYGYRRRTGTDRSEALRVKRNAAELEREQADDVDALRRLYRQWIRRPDPGSAPPSDWVE
jgi:hypothetical protein